MVMCNCVVQEGQISAETEAALRTDFNAFAERNFGERADFNWVAVPKKSGFTAGAPSTSSIVSMRAPKPVEQKRREVLLNELCAIWTKQTKCTLDEIVGVIADPQTN